MSEHDPLLKPGPPIARQGQVENGTVDDISKEPTESPLRLIAVESWIIAKNALPVIASYILQNSIQTGSVFVVGRMGALELSVAAFSYMFAMATTWLLGLGGTTAIDTLASATFASSRDKTKVGVILQRAGVVLGLMYIPFAILWFFSAGFLRLLKQEEELADLVQEFLRVLIPGGVGYVAFEALKKYLQAQNIMQAGTYVLLITSPLNLALNYLFIYSFHMGLSGAALATGLTYWISFGLLVLYTWKINGSQCWAGFSKDALNGLWPMTKLATNGVLMIGTEWWSFEIITIAAGQLGGLDLAAQSVICTSDQLLNTIPFGFGVATTARIGNILGSGNAKKAKLSAQTASWASILIGSVVAIILLATKAVFAKLYTDEQDVINLVSKVMPWVAAFQIADGLVGSNGGSLRAMGKQHYGAVINCVSYYAIGLPVGIYIAFHGWGLEGLWLGSCLALFCVGLSEWLLVSITDWNYETKMALERVDEDQDGRVVNGSVASV